MKLMLTHKQEQAFRRYLYMVAQELRVIAEADPKPQEVGPPACLSFTKLAMDAVYDEMYKDGVQNMPKRKV